MIRLAALGAALLAGAAVGHATSGAEPAGVAVVAVGDGPALAATGFVAAPRRVVTVAHAVEGRDAVMVRGADGVARRAVVVRRAPELDLAVLAVAGARGTAAYDGRVRLHRGPPAPPWGAGLLVRRDAGAGRLPAVVTRRLDARIRSADGHVIARRPVLELRAAARAGDSGAPLVGADGAVTGVVFARSQERAGVAYAVDATALAGLLR